MVLRDYLNVRRVFRWMASEWKCPVWVVRVTIRRMINESWERLPSHPEEKARWEKYFPNGKPTPDQFILLLGRAHERGEEIPFLFKK